MSATSSRSGSFAVEPNFWLLRTDPPTPGRTQPHFRTLTASDAFLGGMKSDGPPPRSIWDPNRMTQSSGQLFRVKTMELPGLDEQRRIKHHGGAGISSPLTSAQTSKTSFGTSFVNESTTSVIDDTRIGLAEPGQPVEEKKLTRATKYYQLLMKAHNKREDGNQKLLATEEKSRAEAAAAKASRNAIKAGLDSVSESSGSTDAEKEEEDLPPLTPYDGSMRVDLEVIVLRAPGEKEQSEPFTEVSEHGSTRTPSSASTKSTPRVDLAEELARLQQEMGVEEEEESDEDDGLPDGFKSIKDAPNPRLALGLGGTVFFVPEAERYAHGPSLPPPPPPSLMGRRRLRLKPRLPLDISNHRYRDEHPNIFPEAGFIPSFNDKIRFEDKVKTYDFYVGCNKALTRLPPPVRAKDRPKKETTFGKMVDEEIRFSQAWKNWGHREEIHRQEKAEQEKKEKEDAKQRISRQLSRDQLSG